MTPSLEDVNNAPALPGYAAAYAWAAR
jgi:hypothetical protein